MILIIGYGNPLRGDDALGQVAGEHLARLFHDDDVDVHIVQQLTPELAERFPAYELVLLVDARHRAPPGDIFLEEVQPGPPPPARPFTHYLTPTELLLLARGLYGAAPRVFLAGITAVAYEVGAPLSPPVAGALPRLYERILALITSHRPPAP